MCYILGPTRWVVEPEGINSRWERILLSGVIAKVARAKAYAARKRSRQEDSGVEFDTYLSLQPPVHFTLSSKVCIGGNARLSGGSPVWQLN